MLGTSRGRRVRSARSGRPAVAELTRARQSAALAERVALRRVVGGGEQIAARSPARPAPPVDRWGPRCGARRRGVGAGRSRSSDLAGSRRACDGGQRSRGAPSGRPADRADAAAGWARGPLSIARMRFAGSACRRAEHAGAERGGAERRGPASEARDAPALGHRPAVPVAAWTGRCRYSAAAPVRWAPPAVAADRRRPGPPFAAPAAAGAEAATAACRRRETSTLRRVDGPSSPVTAPRYGAGACRWPSAVVRQTAAGPTVAPPLCAPHRGSGRTA